MTSLFDLDIICCDHATLYVPVPICKKKTILKSLCFGSISVVGAKVSNLRHPLAYAFLFETRFFRKTPYRNSAKMDAFFVITLLCSDFGVTIVLHVCSTHLP